LPFTDHSVLLYLAFVLSKGADITSLIPSRSTINLSRCLVRSSLRITCSQHVHARGTHPLIGIAGCEMPRQPIGSFAGSLAMPLQSGIEAFDQSFSGEGLGQETGRSRPRSSRPSALDGEGRDEDERHAVSLGKQVGLQLDTAHCRHLNVCYHARGVVQVGRPQELFGRRECMDDVPKRSHEIVGRGANGSVIVND